MRKLATAGLLLVIAWLVTGCAGQRPRVPEPFVSPLIVPTAAPRIYVPAVLQSPRKLGMAGCPEHVASVAAFGLAWCYSWTPDPGLLPRVETVPMIWDETQINRPLVGNSRFVLFFNECNEPTQCNLSPEAAVAPYAIAVRRVRAAGLKVVAPAPSQRDLTWLPRFRMALRQANVDDRFDALAAHCYGDAAYCRAVLTQFMAWAQDWAVGGQPLEVWLTETMQPTAAEARELMAWIAGQPLITRAAIYVSRQDCDDGWTWNCRRDGDPSLLNPDGSLTERGQWYAQPEVPW